MKFWFSAATASLLGAWWKRLSQRGFSFQSVGRPEIDLTDVNTVSALVARVRPDLGLNAAAYTAVDKAESENGPLLTLSMLRVRSMLPGPALRIRFRSSTFRPTTFSTAPRMVLIWRAIQLVPSMSMD